MTLLSQRAATSLHGRWCKVIANASKDKWENILRLIFSVAMSSDFLQGVKITKGKMLCFAETLWCGLTRCLLTHYHRIFRQPESDSLHVFFESLSKFPNWQSHSRQEAGRQKESEGAEVSLTATCNSCRRQFSRWTVDVSVLAGPFLLWEKKKKKSELFADDSVWASPAAILGSCLYINVSVDIP